MNRSRCPKGAEDKGAVVRPKGTWHIQHTEEPGVSAGLTLHYDVVGQRGGDDGAVKMKKWKSEKFVRKK
jgi:hypothetical protein